MALGWFVDKEYSEWFKDFWNSLVLDENSKLRPYQHDDELEQMCYTVLFGELHPNSNCSTLCGGYDSRQRSCTAYKSGFCRRDSIDQAGKRFEQTNYYTIWSKMNRKFEKRKDDIIAVLGQNRFESFMSFLTEEASNKYNKYTRREIKDRGMGKPEVYTLPFLDIMDIENDPWQTFQTMKISKGGLSCSLFSDLEFLA